MSRARPPSVQLSYKIAGCSEHSGHYVPDNIKFDRPHDVTSRWSSAKDNSINGRSWVMIEMGDVALLDSITFGKHYKAHPCNMKDFEVHAGLSKEHLTEVLKSSLKNDPKPEIFPLKHKDNGGSLFPTKFVKIVSLSAYGHNFNTSIWYVALYGIVDKDYVRQVMDDFEKNREVLAMRHILKHLRRRRHITTYRQLQASSGVQFEHPLVSELYEMLVLRGAWEDAEAQMRTLSAAGLLSEYIYSCTPRARWKRLRGTDANGDAPGRRGGHAMCMDAERGLIYLFGGYDGQRSLDDFWVYNVREARWRVLSHSVGEEKNGPGPRACHKMVFDPKSGCIYVLGRLGDSDFQEVRTVAPANAQGAEGGAPAEMAQGATQVRSAWTNRRTVGVGTPASTTPPPSLPPQPSSVRPSAAQDFLSEFYRYRTRGLDQGKWELLNYDTAVKGGPKLIYDHQLVLDSDAQVLYVQGGRVVDEERKTLKYSGLYSYDLRTDKWTMIQANSSDAVFSPRFGHSMVFEPNLKKLFIFAGQKDDYLSDMWEYDIATRSLTELFPNVAAAGGPEPCFAQRAVIDPALKEIYIFAGITRRSTQNSSKLPVSLYKYDTRPGTWTRVLAVESSTRTSDSSPSSSSHRLQPSAKRQRSDSKKNNEHFMKVENIEDNDEDNEPISRRACQVVYDPSTQTFYMHGGTAQSRQEPTRGAVIEADERLDDFWSMKLERPSPEEVVRRATFEIRRQQFREMCEEMAPVAALAFLQNEVSAVVNHEDTEEAANFRSLLSYLFAQSPIPSSPLSPISSAPVVHREDVTLNASPTSSSSGSGEWTSELRSQPDVDAMIVDAPCSAPTESSLPFDALDTGTARGDDDPYELMLRGGKPLSGTRFVQRTEVFESLLRFIERAGRAKQPDGSLLDLVGSSEW